jgi:acyl dehydratase
VSGQFYEDFEVGEVIESPEAYEITPERLHAFAAEFDPQPMHLTDEGARASFFGEMTASGWHTLSVTMRLMVRSPLFESGRVVGVGVEKLRWLRPVRPGDTLRARAEITGKRFSNSRPDQGYLNLRTTTYLDGQPDIIVATQEQTVLVPRRDSHEASTA